MTLMALLLVKHFIFDFWYQPPYMWQNKGTFGHWGGLVHSVLHAASSLVILLFFTTPVIALLVVLGEFVVHYLTDWAKMNINARKGWKCNTHNEFWQLTGFDQLVHQLTYVAMAAIVL